MLDYTSEVHIVTSKIVSKCDNNFYVEITECLCLLKSIVLGRTKDA